MRILVLMMLSILILSGCRSGVDYALNHTEKSYSPVFVYLPNGDIDGEKSFCIVSAQKLSLSGHEFLPVKTREPISVCDRAIGFKGSKLYEFYNKAAFEIRKGAGFQSGKSYEASGTEAHGEEFEQYDFGKINRVRY